jgi:alpha-1,3-rhamnosyl/mannosyltransferase
LHVIYHGIDPAYLADPSPSLPRELVDRGIQPPYLLYFGGEIVRKRLPFAVDVWNRLGRDDVSLVLCGVHPESLAALRDTVAPSRRARLVCPGFVREQDLPALYANANAVLYPTLYEGFGFPALESQATGTPVLMSAVGSLTELIGPASIVLDPDDIDGWTSACASALEGRRPSPAVCREWAGRFRWDDTFDRVLAVYRDVVHRRRRRAPARLAAGNGVTAA